MAGKINLLTSKMEDKKSATFTDHGSKAFGRVPRVMRQTLTVDNGSEFAGFKKFENRTGVTVYFADPYAAWQRGANENTNGLLRQYFPKGSNFKKVTEEDVEDAARKLNHRLNIMPCGKTQVDRSLVIFGNKLIAVLKIHLGLVLFSSSFRLSLLRRLALIIRIQDKL